MLRSLAIAALIILGAHSEDTIAYPHRADALVHNLRSTFNFPEPIVHTPQTCTK